MNIDFEYNPPQEESYIPNDLTLQAMKEAETMAKEKNKKSYATVEELIESLKN
ncbi:antitoxin [Capnocytophaga sp. G1920]